MNIQHYTGRIRSAWFQHLDLLRSPPVDFTPEAAAAFEALLRAEPQAGPHAAPAPALAYTLPYPKHHFLRYIVRHHHVLLHGSNRPDLQQLEPRRQTKALGEPVQAVFATPDDIWPLFFALINNQGFRGSKRNNCLRAIGPDGSMTKFYWFSLSAPMLSRPDAFCDGWIYILPGDSFEPSDIPDEWISRRPVVPLAKLAVGPADFPFFDEITGHSDAEPVWRFFARLLFLGRRGVGLSRTLPK
jgi:hypothetical protein